TLVRSPHGERAAFIDLWTKQWDSGQVNWGHGTCVVLVDLHTGAELRRWIVPAKTHANGILLNGLMGLAFSPNGKKLVACEMDGPVRIWATATGKEPRFLPDGRTHWGGIAFSPDGRTLAIGDSGRVILLLDAENGRDRVRAKGHRGSVTALTVA